MTRKDVVLAVLTVADGAEFTPVQMQKLLFLLDRKVPQLIGGPHFNFKPYDYGPFDKTVYSELRALQEEGLAVIESVPHSVSRRYRASDTGMVLGRVFLQQLGPGVADYIRQLAVWVRRQTFASLVSSIYKEYPEMKANSIFGKQ